MRSDILRGGDILVANLSILEKNMNHKVADAMRKAGGMVETRSVEKTPLKTGELRARSFNEGPLLDDGVYTQVIGYEKHTDTERGTEYAVPVHEKTYVRHKVGKAKFLEDAVNELGPELGAYLQKQLKEVRL